MKPNTSNTRLGMPISGVAALVVGMITGLASAAEKQGTSMRTPRPQRAAQQTPPPTKIDLVRDLVKMIDLNQAPNGDWLPPAPTDADYRVVDRDMARLGELLFHDKILSGNMNISCATCHNMMTDTSDGLSLPIGEGGNGLGPARDTGFAENAVHERVPRNAPHVFNLGAHEFEIMMHDGRIAADPNQPSGFATPAGNDLMLGLDSVVAAQACFPVTSSTEMAGQPGENAVADAAAAGDLPLVWELLAQRVRAVDLYVEMFPKAYPEIHNANDITYTHIANAIAAYEESVGRADHSPFDRFLRGDTGAMSMSAVEGMTLFYGKAGCVDCHSGSFQTNQGFAAIAMPQIGPGKGHNQPGYSDGLDDLGLGAETGNPADNFRFRVPSLRNVALTGPWGHDGAYSTLEGVVRHHLNPEASLLSYDEHNAVLPQRLDLNKRDMVVMRDEQRVLGILAANELAPVSLSDDEFNALMDFLHALTDPRSMDLRHAIPMSVPSGLPMYD